MPTPDPLLDPDRLAAVAELNLSNAPQQPVFEHLNQLAHELLGVPVSVVSLVTDSRQVNLSQFGVIDDHVSHHEVPLSHSLCQHVARSGEALVIEDAIGHELVGHSLPVLDYDVAAYAGVPLKLDSGEVVGAMCAVDYAPRRWTPSQLMILRRLTAVASELLNQRRRLEAGALRDAVTGLPRTALFTEHVTALLAAVEPHERVVMVGIDLDGFRTVNDDLGQAGGDAVLADIGLRLEQTIHRGRRPGHVSRLSGDTFLAATVIGRSEPATRVQDDLLAAIAASPARYGTREVAVRARGASVVAPPHGTAAALVESARRAVREADPADTNPAEADAKRRRLMIRNRLWTAQSRGEFVLDYQPIYDLTTGSVSGFEALLRWHNADLGDVTPNEFIPLAEQNGSIVPIGQWVLSQALADLAHWRCKSPERDLTVSVNVAPEQLLLTKFSGQVMAALKAAGVPASALILEVTERTLGEDQPILLANLVELRKQGVRISVDDFGTGYSSLSRLATLPLDELKIDRSFIAAMQTDERQHALVATIIAMADTLGLTPVAEGIETPEQHDALTAIGCTLGQGYLIARPAPASHMQALIPADARTSQR
jgi:diguanylate cyclase (GGDEF)-like protein